MNTPQNSNKGFNEIIFENRNKAYGAYSLRLEENATVFKSLITTALFFISIAIFSYYLSNREDKINTDVENIVPIIDWGREIDNTPKELPKELPKEKPNEAPKSESGQATASDEKNDNNLSTNNDLNVSKNPNPDGKPADSTSTEPKEPVVVKKPNDELERFPDEIPSFIGSMQQFMNNNLHYPVIARESNAQGTVYISFVVEKDGSLSSFNIAKGNVGYGCEEEAIRVLKQMPKWKAGIKKGEAVRYPCTLPIKFSLK